MMFVPTLCKWIKALLLGQSSFTVSILSKLFSLSVLSVDGVIVIACIV